MSATVGTVDAPLGSAKEPCPRCGGELRSCPAFNDAASDLLAFFYAGERYAELRQLREVWCVDEDCDFRGSARG